MTHITYRLTAKNRDQLRNLTLSNRVWATEWLCLQCVHGSKTYRNCTLVVARLERVQSTASSDHAPAALWVSVLWYRDKYTRTSYISISSNKNRIQYVYKSSKTNFQVKSRLHLKKNSRRFFTWRAILYQNAGEDPSDPVYPRTSDFSVLKIAWRAQITVRIIKVTRSIN